MVRKVQLLYPDLSYKVRGCFFTIRNTLGFGHKEIIYQKALVEEFTRQKITFEREKSIPIKYLGKHIGNYRPDFIVENKIIIEIKAVDFIPKQAENQLVYYLKSTEMSLGFLVNFGSPELKIIRKIWTPHFKGSRHVRDNQLLSAKS